MERKKMKLWKKVLIVIGIVWLLCIIDFSRKLMIYNDLQNKLSSYENSSNYYIKVMDYSEGQLDISQKFKKDEKSMISHQTILSNAPFSHMNYRVYVNDQESPKWYITNDGENYTLMPNQPKMLLDVNIPNYLSEKKENKIDYLKMVATSSVKSEVCNEKECYKITRVDFSNRVLNKEYNKEYIYIEKSTGLVIRYEANWSNSITNYKYSFGTIMDKTLKEPDLSEYELQEN